MQSDLRLYESDHNATIEKYFSAAIYLTAFTKIWSIRLAQSPAHFASSCANLISRMIDVSRYGYAYSVLLIQLQTVPSGVSLTPAIDPRALGHANISLNVDWSGQMTLTGFFRVCKFFPRKIVHTSHLSQYVEVAGSPSAPENLKYVKSSASCTTRFTN